MKRTPHRVGVFALLIVALIVALPAATPFAINREIFLAGDFVNVHPLSDGGIRHEREIKPGRDLFGKSEGEKRFPEPGEIGTSIHRRVAWSSTPLKNSQRAPFDDVDLTAETKGRSAEPLSLSTDPQEAARVKGLIRLLHDRGLAHSVDRPAQEKLGNIPFKMAAPWTTDHLLADATNMNDEYVSIAASPISDNLYAVFEATDLGGTDRDIHIAQSTDGGATWSVWEMPSFSQDEYHPEIAIDAGGYLLVTWIRADGYILRSKTANADDPLLWSWVKGLNVGETCATPSIAAKRQGSNGKVFIAAAWNTLNYDLFAYEWTLIWMYSSDGGETIDYDYFLPDGYNDYWPDVALKGATCYFINAEQDYYTGELEVLVAADAMSGGFSNVSILTDWTGMDCKFPAIANEAESVYMAFQLDYDDGLGNIDGDIVYSYSWDGLTTIYGPFEMVADEYESVGPAIYTKNGVVGCLWLDAPAGADEFYLAARQAGGFGLPEFWGDIEIASDYQYVNPTYHAAFGLTTGDRLHAAWIDRRNFPTQGLNVYTCDRGVEPNLSPFTPADWETTLVAGMTPGVRTTTWLAADDTTYISFAFINSGLSDIAADFQFRLLVDGAPAATWVLAGGLPVSTYVTVEDFPIVVSAGTHSVGYEVDHLTAVTESDETDNTHTDTFNFVDGEATLRFNPDQVTHHYDNPVTRQSETIGFVASPPLRYKSSMEVVSPRLATAMVEEGASAMHRVMIVPAAQVDVNAAFALLEKVPAGERRRMMADALKGESERGMTTLRERWDPLVARGAMSDPASLWLSGTYFAMMNAEAIDEMADHPAVARLWLDDQLLEPRIQPGGAAARADATTAPMRSQQMLAQAWHLATIGAPTAWASGYDGSGILIGHLDSGVAYDHPDLAGHLWDGAPAYPNHGWDCVDEDNDPYDGDTQIYHGTHTAGLLVGDGTSGTTTGAAPGAELMILRCMPGYQADMAEALQFCLDNGADMISMSAGWINPSSDLRATNRFNAEVLLSAGIPWVCAAGNGDNVGGHLPLPTDIASPGDCPNPWYGTAGNSAVISVGAVNSTNGVWQYSSYGPTEWNIVPSPDGYNDYPYPPGLIKPDVAAPGVAVTSTTPPATYVTYDGTSMATPLVAGACAILMQASPGVLPSQIAEALENGALDLTTSPASAGRDNYTGAGLINIPASIDLLPTADQEIFYVCNDGQLPLILGQVAWGESWLQVSPLSGAINPGDSLSFSALISPEGLGWGVYSDQVVVTSNDPASPSSLPVTVTVGEATNVAGPTPPAVRRTLLDNRPNPFNPQTAIQFDSAARGEVILSIYTLNGRLVRRLVDQVLDSGSHEVVWNGRDDRNREMASGIYLARLETVDGRRTSRKLTLLR